MKYDIKPAGMISSVDDLDADPATFTGCSASDVTSCVKVGSDANIVVGSAPNYPITSTVNILGGKVSSVQISCTSASGTVQSEAVTLREKCAFSQVATPAIASKNYDGSASTQIVSNALTTFFTGQDCASQDYSKIQCLLVNSPAGVSMGSTYPFAISAPTNNLSGATLNIQVQCKFITPVVSDNTYVQSNVASFV